MSLPDRLREYMKREYKTVGAVAREWGLKDATVAGVLSGRLVPNAKATAFLNARIGNPSPPATFDEVTRMFNDLMKELK